ncbi:DUF6364 family protein [Niabella hirudinis]|uniref:DUF6364 family protein n=1 Tax=Niabella hirudinis TaxID=1285929 RepID=UPI003EBEA818
MDAKVTLSFNSAIIEGAKEYAASEGLSLSRLVELLLQKVIATGRHQNIEHIPIEDWVNMVAEGPATYNAKPIGKKQKAAFYKSHK